MRRISPFFMLDQVKTPTPIAGGEDDCNVPILNSKQLFIALKRHGVPAKLVRVLWPCQPVPNKAVGNLFQFRTPQPFAVFGPSSHGSGV